MSKHYTLEEDKLITDSASKILPVIPGRSSRSVWLRGQRIGKVWDIKCPAQNRVKYRADYINYLATL